MAQRKRIGPIFRFNTLFETLGSLDRNQLSLNILLSFYLLLFYLIICFSAGILPFFLRKSTFMTLGQTRKFANEYCPDHSFNKSKNKNIRVIMSLKRYVRKALKTFLPNGPVVCILCTCRKIACTTDFALWNTPSVFYVHFLNIF